MPVEHLLDDATLNSTAAPMDELDLHEAGFGGDGNVFVDDRRNVARMERVQIERVFEGNAVRHARAYVAVT